MIVCLCHSITDRDIAREARSGCASFEELQNCLRVGTACGSCLNASRELFDEHAAPRLPGCRSLHRANPSSSAASLSA